MLFFVIATIFLNAKAIKAYSSLQTLLYSDWISCDHSRDLNLNVDDVMVYIFDFQANFNATFKINDAVNGITSGHNLNKTKKLVFYVPGYKADISYRTTETILKRFRTLPHVYLVIIDYSIFKNRGGKKREYENSIQYSYYIGKALGEMLADLHDKGLSSQNIHCVGSSLGAQILGYTGETYLNKTAEKIWRITGLDPAGPCFSNNDIKEQLRSGLGEYVEVYHCNAGVLGTSSVLGDFDVFLNIDGKIQPNCREELGEYEAAECSHKVCLSLWARTVGNSDLYSALACDSYEAFINGICAGNESTIAGYSNPGNATGVFYAGTEIV